MLSSNTNLLTRFSNRTQIFIDILTRLGGVKKNTNIGLAQSLINIIYYVIFKVIKLLNLVSGH